MKKTILTLVFALISVFVFAQTKQKFIYLVGSANFPQYDLKVKEATINSNKKTKSKAPVIVYFEQNKNEYVGGMMVDEKGNKTIIKDIIIYNTDSSSVMLVKGETFSKTLNTKTDLILKNENDETVFYENKVGAWKIFRKNK